MGYELGSLGGLTIFEDINMVDYHEDWSGVRSHGRAARRRKLGFPQRIKITATPKKEAVQFGSKVFMHPEMARQMRAMISERLK